MTKSLSEVLHQESRPLPYWASLFISSRGDGGANLHVVQQVESALQQHKLGATIRARGGKHFSGKCRQQRAEGLRLQRHPLIPHLCVQLERLV